MNIYPGWYDGDLQDLGPVMRRKLESLRRMSRDKPVILSEFGAAAIPGARSFELRKWTEDYQSELLCHVIAHAQRSGFISGVAIWQYCDMRSSADFWGTRPREYNNKGIVTAYREPKLAFHRVAEQFRRGWRIG
jgi:beta-glucuronidase